MRTGRSGSTTVGRGELAREVLGRVAEVDGQPADDERRPDDDRVADPLGEGQRLLDAVGHPALGLRDAEPVEQGREPDALLGLVDGLEVRAEQRHAAGRQRRGEVERRLAAERDDRREEVRARSGVSASMTLRTLSGSSGSKYSRDEASKSVETVSGFELIITARQPRLAERVGGLDRAVVELDPLPDPDRPAADDEGRLALDRRRLRRGAGRGVGRVEVRRLGRELGGAGVDHRVARARGPAPAARPASRLGRRAGQAGQLACRRSRRA